MRIYLQATFARHILDFGNSSAPVTNECHSDRREESFTAGTWTFSRYFAIQISRSARNDNGPELLRILICHFQF